jgi:hypothetical protein
MLKVLEEDFARIPSLLDRVVEVRPAAEADEMREPEPEAVQLGLF